MKASQTISKNQYEYMTTAPVGSLILSLAVPSMVTTLITSIYNLADTFFVGRIGTSASAAVGVVFSIPMSLNALGFLVGTGASCLVSSYLGAKRDREADITASTAFFLSFLFGSIVAIAGLAAGASLMRLLGATDSILPYALSYGRYILLAAPFSASSLGLSQCLRAEGKSRESMVGQVAGGILNMALDPVFIFPMGLGIAGAAMATALSQVISWCILISYYLRGKTQVHISLRFMARGPIQYGRIFKAGFPSLCRHGCNMLANVALNWIAGGWGDAAIAAMSISGRLLYLSNAVSTGMNQGSQPVIGYAHGMGNHKRVKEAFLFAIKISMTSMAAFALFCLAFAPGLIGLFRDDAEVIRVGATALRLICLALPLANFYGSATILFQVVGRTAASSILIFSRQLAFYIPALLILPYFAGLLGVQMAGPAADVATFCLAVPMVMKYFRATAHTAEK